MSMPSDEETIAQINIIPFVDIILVILIIFMVTAPQVIKKGFSITLPQSSSAARPSVDSHLDILVTHTGDIFIKGRLVSINDLSFHTKKLTESRPSAKVNISADKSVSHGRVMEIVNIIKASGIHRFMFSTAAP